MARIGVRSRSLGRSLVRKIPFDHAVLASRSERVRTPGPNRQAGGHWFEPSTAHRKALHKGFFVAPVGDHGLAVARIDARNEARSFSGRYLITRLARIQQ